MPPGLLKLSELVLRTSAGWSPGEARHQLASALGKVAVARKWRVAMM